MNNSEKRSVISSDEEKTAGTNHAAAPSLPSQPPAFDESVVKRARTKLDVFVLPLVILMYFLSFLDRSNIGNAKVAGFQKDIGLSNHQYSIGLTVFYVSYICVEIPSNLVVKKIGPNRLLPGLVFIWGIITICQGTVRGFGGFVTARFFLGLAEGGLSPGLVLYLASFYRREDLQLRMSLLYCATALAGAFSGLLAAAIQQMNGVLGHRGWEWIFFLEGLATSVLAIFVFFVMPESPTKVFLLNDNEKKEYTKALQASWPEQDVGPINLREAFSIFKDPQTIYLSLITFSAGCMLAGLSYFASPVIQSLGYSSTRTQLMSVPPFAVAAVVSVLVAIISDRYRQRGFVIAFSSLLALIGYIIFYNSHQKHTLYGSIFFQVTGVYATSPAIAAWIANNTWPHYKRATMLAWGFMFTSMGSILSVWLFNDPPRNHKGISVDIGLAALMVTCPLVARLYYMGQNAKKAKARAASDFDDSSEARRRLGDAHPSYVYSL